MKRTFFDKIVMVILMVIVGLFIVLACYTTYATQKVLITEKQNSLLNEAVFLSEQSISLYIQKKIQEDDLEKRFDQFENTLKTNVWFFGPKGELIAASNMDKNKNIPKYIMDFDSAIDLKEPFSKTGNYNDAFENTMISTGVPISRDDKLEGYLVLHTEITVLDDLQDEMLQIMYMPFVVILLVVAIVLAYLSGTILRPVAKITNTAKEYAKGNFDARTGVHRKDELGELSDSLEYMAVELSKLDEYRKNFIANISHDFRSPLTSIKGYLEAMLDGTIPPDKYDRYLKIVLSESNRLTKLTSGLLELNTFDTKGPDLKKSFFDIINLINETKNTLEGLGDKKKIRFLLNISTKNTLVYADKMKIGQVIYNLVDNAIKFSPEHGKITITVYEKHDKIFVSIKDEGPGIEKDKQNKVWGRFYKTDSSRGKDKKGTGLGLAITKEIIKAHGENINLISTEGAGSDFVFSLSKEAHHK